MIDSQDSLEQYVSSWRERSRLMGRAEEERRRVMRQRLLEVVDRLVREFGVTRVVLFGSLAREESTLHSDVDLLVEGLAVERLLEASVVADRTMKDAHVDLVPVQVARPDVRERAETEGEILYG